MEINVRGKNIDVTPSLEEYVQKKLSKLDKFFEENVDVQVVLAVTRDEHVVEITALYNSLILRSEESTGDMYASIDSAVDKIEKQVVKFRKKMNQRLRQNNHRQISDHLASGEREDQKLSEDDEEPKVVRTKQFILKPMNVEEAILQMNLLGHDFFVFNSADTETVSVVYRRKDGNYGLIEPEF